MLLQRHKVVLVTFVVVHLIANQQQPVFSKQHSEFVIEFWDPLYIADLVNRLQRHDRVKWPGQGFPPAALEKTAEVKNSLIGKRGQPRATEFVHMRRKIKQMIGR